MTIKSAAEIERMAAAGRLTAKTLDMLAGMIREGISTRTLDAAAEEFIRAHGAKPSFLGFEGYPRSICVSINSEVVHGIPGPRVLRDGDILSIDFGAIVDGWHGDAARTVLIGDVSDQARDLVAAAREAMWAGIGAIRRGARVGDVSAAVEASVRGHAHRYGIVREYTGHGIGSAMHQLPDVPNWGRPHRGARIERGMALAIEPMLTLGTERVVEGDDEWTVSTADGSLAAHWEDTVAVMADGLWVLTEPDGGRAELEARGVPCAGDAG